MVAVAVAVCPGMRGHLGARTLQVGRDPSNGPTSCLHAPTASQAGRRRFDPGRPLSSETFGNSQGCLRLPAAPREKRRFRLGSGSG